MSNQWVLADLDGCPGARIRVHRLLMECEETGRRLVHDPRLRFPDLSYRITGRIGVVAICSKLGDMSGSA